VAINEELSLIIEEEAAKLKADPALCKAIAVVESGFNPLACRYEPHWKHFYRPEAFARLLSQSEATERVHQATSFGAMQIMGAVARELGFTGYLAQLAADPRLAVRYSIRHLQKFQSRYEAMEWAVSAYNCGTPKKLGGRFQNQGYVDKILRQLAVFNSKES
jgi:soluble lytic murein transglycosylase-like protein